MSNSATLWTVAHQGPQLMGFSRQEYWSGSPCPPPGDLLKGIKPMSLVSPTLADGFFTTNAILEAPTKLLTFCQTELKDFFSFVTFHRIYFLPKTPSFFLHLATELLLSFIIQHSDFFCECLWLFQTDLFWLIHSIFNWNSALNSIDRLTFSIVITLFICLYYWYVNSIKARTHITFWNQSYQLTASPLMTRDPHQSHSILSL